MQIVSTNTRLEIAVNLGIIFYAGATYGDSLDIKLAASMAAEKVGEGVSSSEVEAKLRLLINSGRPI